MEFTMNFQKIFIILALVSGSQLFAMKRASSGIFRASRIGSPSVFQRSLQPFYKSLASASLQSTRVKRKASNLTSHRTFSTSPITLGFWDTFKWHFKSEEQKKEELFEEFKEKVQNFASFSEITFIDLVEKMKKEGLINQTYCGSTPLKIAIIKSKKSSSSCQMSIITILKEHGVQLHNSEALQLAIGHYNIGALRVLQPHFSLMELFQQFLQVKSALNTMESYPWIDKQAMQKMYDILNQRVEKQRFSKGFMTSDGKEYETTFEASTCEELYNGWFSNNNSKTYKQKAQSNYSTNGHTQTHKTSQKVDEDFNATHYQKKRRTRAL
jgi:hypothetical protein